MVWTFVHNLGWKPTDLCAEQSQSDLLPLLRDFDGKISHLYGIFPFDMDLKDKINLIFIAYNFEQWV